MGTYVTGKFGPPEKFGPPPGTNSVNTRTPGTYFTTTLDPTIWTTPPRTNLIYNSYAIYKHL